MRHWLIATMALLFGPVAPALAQADYPTKPVVIVVPFPAGGSSDSVTRALADELSKTWKQQVVIDNKAGGGTVVGNTFVARAKPDGYTLLMVSGSFAILPAIRSDLPYDPVKDFVPVSVFIDSPLGIVTRPDFPANNLAELIEEAKKRPPDRPLTYASAGVASTSHMIGELIQRRTGIRLKHIPYSGESAAVPDVLAGRVDFQMGTWLVQRPNVESGKLKLLTAMYKSRLPERPDTPILTETISGLGSPLAAFNQIMVPAGTPPEVIEKIAAAIKLAVAAPSFRERIATLGSYPRDTSPAEAAAFLRSEMAIWDEIAKAANIKLN